jgi:hypothetical protein
MPGHVKYQEFFCSSQEPQSLSSGPKVQFSCFQEPEDFRKWFPFTPSPRKALFFGGKGVPEKCEMDKSPDISNVWTNVGEFSMDICPTNPMRVCPVFVKGRWELLLPKREQGHTGVFCGV